MSTTKPNTETAPKVFTEDKWAELPQKNRERILNTMAKYGDNKWWESKDPMHVARFQLFEPVLLVNFGVFHEGTGKLLGRPVYTSEFGLNYDGLKEEAMKRIAALDAGTLAPLTESEIKEKTNGAEEQLAEYAAKNGKRIIPISSTSTPEEVASTITKVVRGGGKDPYLAP